MVEKRANKFRQGSLPFRAMLEKNNLFLREVFPMFHGMDDQLLDKTRLRPGRQGGIFESGACVAQPSMVSVTKDLQGF